MSAPELRAAALDELLAHLDSFGADDEIEGADFVEWVMTWRKRHGLTLGHEVEVYVPVKVILRDGVAVRFEADPPGAPWAHAGESRECYDPEGEEEQEEQDDEPTDEERHSYDSGWRYPTDEERSAAEGFIDAAGKEKS